jgi:uncharacterized lipoprotein NlpE involved in copper resistance
MAAWDAADESFFDRQRIQVEVSLDARDHAARTADALEKMANLLADIADAIIEAYGDGGHAK